ncbi:DUF6681 family protein [Ligilactobacillus salivarius]
MFSILGLINTWIGYINMNVKIKNRVYTIVGGVGNFYLLYVAWRFFANGFIGRGLLFILAFLVLLYFTYLNAIYWFTEKKAKWDISPKIENALGIKSKDPEEEARKKVARMRQAGFVQTNGIFDENQDFLPAEITTSEAELANIQIVADSLKKINYLHLDYDGKSKNTIFKEIKSDGKVRYALGETPQALPYFELKNVEGKLVIYGGINQIESYQLGTVKTIGLMPASEAAKKYHIYLATVVLTGGPFMIAGRSTAMEDNEPFRIDAKIAYTSREKKAASKVASSYYEKTSSVEDEHLSRRRDRRR